MPPRWNKSTREALRQLAGETRERAAQARDASREMAAEREALIAALNDGLRAQSAILTDITASRAQLQQAVTRYAEALRRRELPPERMLVELKNVVRQQNLPRGREGQAIMDQLVRWSIEGYFATPDVHPSS